MAPMVNDGGGASALCGECGAKGHAEESAHSIIGLGWRLVRMGGEEGPLHVDWRCPTCWDRHRQTRDAMLALAQRAREKRSLAPKSSVRPTRASGAPKSPQMRAPGSRRPARAQ
jgi:hypothetical protein